MNIRKYASAHGLTVGEVYILAWKWAHYGKQCTTGEVIRDHARWEKSGGKVESWYVAKFLKAQGQLPTMPNGAAK